MPGTIITCSSTDSVRIVVAGTGSVTLPAARLLAAAQVLNEVSDSDAHLYVERIAGTSEWEAGVWWKDRKAAVVGHGDTPLEAVAALAAKLDAR